MYFLVNSCLSLAGATRYLTAPPAESASVKALNAQPSAKLKSFISRSKRRSGLSLPYVFIASW